MCLFVWDVDIARADNHQAFVGGPYRAQGFGLGGLPPFDLSDVGFLEYASKPLESQSRITIAERVLRLKTVYQKREFTTNPFADERWHRHIFALQGQTRLIKQLLQTEAEVAFNGFDQFAADNLGPKLAGLYRLNLHGTWQGHKYGGEFRSIQKDFMHVRGGAAGRSENSLSFWGESRIGPVNLKGRVSQLWERLNESKAMPRFTRGSSVSLNYKKGKWNSTLSTAYSVRSDRFDTGSTTDIYGADFHSTYHPIGAFKITPRLAYAAERDRNSDVVTETPLGSLTLSYEAWRKWFALGSHTEYRWSRSSDGSNAVRDFSSKVKFDWQLDRNHHGRKTFSLELVYSNHRDLVLRGNSNQGFSARATFTLLKF